MREKVNLKKGPEATSSSCRRIVATVVTENSDRLCKEKDFTILARLWGFVGRVGDCSATPIPSSKARRGPILLLILQLTKCSDVEHTGVSPRLVQSERGGHQGAQLTTLPLP